MGEPKKYPKLLALIDPFCDWRDSPRRSEARRDGLHLVVSSVSGVWVYEIFREGEPTPVQAGGLRGWNRADAKNAATRQAEVIRHQGEKAKPANQIRHRTPSAIVQPPLFNPDHWRDFSESSS